MKKFGIAACALVASLGLGMQAHASDAAFGYISGPFGMSNGAVLFFTSGARTTPPACSGPNLERRYALNASTIAGQSQLSVLMTAYAMGKRITIHGTGTCSIWGDTETVDYFAVEE